MQFVIEMIVTIIASLFMCAVFAGILELYDRYKRKQHLKEVFAQWQAMADELRDEPIRFEEEP